MEPLPHPLSDDGRVTEPFRASIAAAVEVLDRPSASARATALAAAIRSVPALAPRAGLGPVLGDLRRLRLFRAMRDVAGAAIEAAPDLVEVRRQYGQALIEAGELMAALSVLQALAAETSGVDPTEHAEACGLIGRVHKQVYVGAANPSLPRFQDRLRWAARAYYDVYQEAPHRHRWHGVNVVALLYRAECDGVIVDGFPARHALAAEVLAAALAADPVEPWDLATAMEASVGLDDLDGALRYAYRYVRCPTTDAFMLASTLRQMTEVWDLDRDDGGPRQEIVDLLRAHLLDMERGGFRISPDETEEGARLPDGEDRHLEAILGRNAYVTIGWYRRGLITAQAVGMVRSGPNPVGTGFLLWSDGVGLAGPRRPVLLTNNHVLSDRTNASRAVHSDYAEIVFEAAPGGPFETAVDRLVFEHPPMTGLDVTVATLRAAPPGVAPLRPSLGPPLNEPDSVRLYSIGHPKGGGLAFSIQDNLLLDVRPPLVHYRTPTDKGSSGSPVLNHDWNVVGVHRAGGRLRRLNGSGLYSANEGVLLPAVVDAVAATHRS